MRFCFAAFLALAAGTAAAAEPAKHDPKPSIGRAQTPAKVVMASADEPRSTAPSAQRAGNDAKRPAPRVTACRCGDPQPDEEQPDR